MIINETLQTIRRRRSVRVFKDQQIGDQELQVVLEAGLCAPNAGNQSWHFTAIQNGVILRKLNLAAKECARKLDNEGLRKLGNDETFDCLHGAPTLILVSADEKSPIPLGADCAAATENMLLAARVYWAGIVLDFLCYTCIWLARRQGTTKNT